MTGIFKTWTFSGREDAGPVVEEKTGEPTRGDSPSAQAPTFLSLAKNPVL
jgi:hypothetical protein